MTRSALRVFAGAALAASVAVSAAAQSPNCGILQGTALEFLPGSSGTIPGSADMSLGGDDTYLYVLTQWGFARASLANAGDPGPYVLTNIGRYHGNGGKIPITCDCHQGSNTMDVAQAPDGTARMISDWQPFRQGQGGSGLAAQMGQATGPGSPSFGQQIDLPQPVPQGSRLAAIYTGSGRFFGYFPVEADGVYVANMQSPSGLVEPPMSASLAIGWTSSASSVPGVRLKAAHVNAAGYSDKYILAGTTYGDNRLHVAEINPTTGGLVEVASGNLVGGEYPSVLDIAVVNGEIFIFASSEAGLHAYAFNPPSGTLSPAGSIAGSLYYAAVRGPAALPGDLPAPGDADGLRDRHLRLEVADPGRLAAASEDAQARRRERCQLHRERLRGARQAERRSRHGLPVSRGRNDAGVSRSTPTRSTSRASRPIRPLRRFRSRR